VTGARKVQVHFCENLVEFFSFLQPVHESHIRMRGELLPTEFLADVQRYLMGSERSCQRLLSYLDAVLRLDVPVIRRLLAGGFLRPIDREHDLDRLLKGASTPAIRSLWRLIHRPRTIPTGVGESVRPSEQAGSLGVPEGEPGEEHRFCSELVRDFPRLRPILERHLRRWKELLPSEFLCEVRERLHVDDSLRREVLRWIDRHVASESPRLRILIAIGFVSTIDDQAQLAQTLEGARAPNIRRLWHFVHGEPTMSPLPHPTMPPPITVRLDVPLSPEFAAEEVFSYGLVQLIPELRDSLEEHMRFWWGEFFPYAFLPELVPWLLRNPTSYRKELVRYLDYQLMAGTRRIRSLVGLAFVMYVDTEEQLARLLEGVDAPTIRLQWECIYRSTPEGCL